MENTAKALVMMVASIVSMVMLAVVVTVPARAQEGERRIDSAHSTASLSLLSSRGGTTWNVSEVNINWSNAYSGANYGEPVARSTSGTITFVIESDQIKTKQGSQISGLTTIPLRDFPTLRASWLDSVWPLVVEDEHCEIPDVRGSTRDYQGAVCTGTPIEFTPLRQPSQVRIGADYPGPDEVTAPASDAATIMIHLRLEGGP